MTVFMRLAAVAALCGLLLFTTPAQAQIQTQAASQAEPAVWGLYTRLAGTTRQAIDGYQVRWHWSQPGKDLVEEYIAPRTGKVAYTATITPGASPGTLHMKGSALGGKAWNGTVQPDGSVVFIGTGLLKMHFKAVLASDGAYEIRTLKLRDGAVVSVGEPISSSRYLPVEDVAGAGIAAAPAAAAPKTNPGMAPAAPAVRATTSVPAVAPAAAPPPASALAAPVSFGYLDKYVGRSLVGNSADGITFTLDVHREGDALVLRRGFLGGQTSGRIVLRPTAVPGAFELVETWNGGSGGNRSAYLVGSPGAPVSSPLDGYYGDPREPGDLVIGYDVSGGYVVINFHPTESGGLRWHQHGGNRRFGVRGAIGKLDYVDTGWFSPVTDKAIAEAESYSQSESQRQEEMRREEARERAEQQSRMQAALYDSLVQANEIASANEARSRAALDATLAQAAQQAAYERQQQAGATHSAQDVQNARAATERQYEIARQYEARQQARRAQQAAAQREASASGLRSSSAGEASTRERADGCVGQPMTSTHQCGSNRAGLKGRVVNSCAAPVDVRMCFMTATGWSCQSNYGLAPERAWEPGDCGATGQVFRSVRYSDSKEPLATP